MTNFAFRLFAVTLPLCLFATACSGGDHPVTAARDGGSTTADAASDDASASDSSPTTDAGSGTKHTVVANNFAYSPAQLTVKVGDTVEWTFTAGTHSVTSGTNCTSDGKVDSGNRAAPFTFTHTFTEVGRFDYFCSYREHCTMMGQVGVVTITE